MQKTYTLWSDRTPFGYGQASFAPVISKNITKLLVNYGRLVYIARDWFDKQKLDNALENNRKLRTTRLPKR